MSAVGMVQVPGVVVSAADSARRRLFVVVVFLVFAVAEVLPREHDKRGRDDDGRYQKQDVAFTHGRFHSAAV